MRTPPSRTSRSVVLVTALILALVTAIPSGATPDGTNDPVPAPTVERGRYDSYVVVMKADPLVVTEGKDNLRTARARNKGQEKRQRHARVMRDVGLSPDRITTD